MFTRETRRFVGTTPAGHPAMIQITTNRRGMRKLMQSMTGYPIVEMKARRTR